MPRLIWSDEPCGDGWYWVYLPLGPYPDELYMTLLFKGRHCYVLNSKGRVPSGGQVRDLLFAKARWWGPLKEPILPDKAKKKKKPVSSSRG